jgi:hypothetical protein
MTDFDDKALQSLNRFQIENTDLQGELVAKNVEIAALRATIKHAEMWVEAGLRGSWIDGVLIEIKAALKKSEEA